MSASALLAAGLAWLDWSLMPWFTAWAVPVSRLEGLACVLSLWMVACNLRVNPLGWPLAMLSSLLYGLLFLRSRLYGEAGLQLVFVLVSAWGWLQWRKGDASQGGESVTWLSTKQRALALVALLFAWPALGLLLHVFTDSDVPFADALPTAGSLLGQWLLARKRVENWPCWLGVNLFSVALFAHKQLWLTVWLYAVFALLSAWGWQQWRTLARHQAPSA